MTTSLRTARANQSRATAQGRRRCAPPRSPRPGSARGPASRARPGRVAERGRGRLHAGLALGADRGPQRDPGPLPDRLLGAVEAGARTWCPRSTASPANASTQAAMPQAFSSATKLRSASPCRALARSRSPSCRRPPGAHQARRGHPRVAALTRDADGPLVALARPRHGGPRAGKGAEVRVRERRRPPEVRPVERERLAVQPPASSHRSR